MSIVTGTLPLLQVKWKDHAQFAETRWRSREEVAKYLGKDTLIDSVGWKIYDDKDKIILAAVIDDESNSRSEITIFKTCIVKQRRIK